MVTKIDSGIDKAPEGAGEPEVLGIYHANVNSSNIATSQAFYEMLGFKLLEKFNYVGEPELDRGLGIPFTDTTAHFMGIGKNRHETIIDLVEWNQPRSSGGNPGLSDLGMPRLALRVKNIDAMYSKLKAAGVPIVAPIEQLKRLANAECRFFICKDPDGLFVELVELSPKKSL